MSFDVIQNNSKGPFCTLFTILYIAIWWVFDF